MTSNEVEGSRSTSFTRDLVQDVRTEAAELIENGDVAKRALAGAGYEPLDLVSPLYKNFFSGQVEGFPGVEYVDRTSVKVTDPDSYMEALTKVYSDDGQVLNPRTAQAISNRISDPQQVIRQGLPGTHAEVQATNWIYNA